MRNIKIFDTVEEYDLAKSSGELDGFSNLCHVKENRSIHSTIFYSDFIAPKYFGIINTDEITEEVILGLSRIEKPSYQYTCDPIISVIGRVLYAYPYEKKLKSILDQNNFEYIEDFKSDTIDIDGITYTYYVLSENSDLTEMIFNFK